MTSSSAPDSPAPAGSRSGTFRVVLLGVLVVALLASAGSLVWLLAGRRGEADDVQRQREAVMAQAEQFMLRLNTYGPDLLDSKGEMPKYRQLVEAVITPKFKSSFEQGVTAAEQTVAQAGVDRTAKVFAVGVSSLDADSATALVAGSFTNTYPQGKRRVADDPSPFRIEVTLVKTGGTWLVDDFTPVTGAEK
ncbi:hypothetical protein H5V45_08100 [Nocardioides sp. KIGAM211]|uniref:Mce-associated membrane protein n=1 Tax=Nocardioides luti TaxID=2761101 RepID=A0A7X0VAU0_9ACTN|nr:hypothetical protein [Nocardioides luti]MBB6627282.1 hypothetical protein [Nocardioides luti]